MNKTIKEINKIDGFNIKRILFVDDDLDILEVLAKSGILRGHHVTTYGDSEFALREIRSNGNNYDLAFLDNKMPNLTGSQLAKIMLKEYPNIKIGILTGDSNAIDKSLDIVVYEKPCVTYLEKAYISEYQ